MPQLYRVVLGRQSSHAEVCRADGFIGVDFGVIEDLTEQLPDNWKEFNSRYIPIVMTNNPKKTKIGAGLACGMLLRGPRRM